MGTVAELKQRVKMKFKGSNSGTPCVLCSSKPAPVRLSKKTKIPGYTGRSQAYLLSDTDDGDKAKAGNNSTSTNHAKTKGGSKTGGGRKGTGQLDDNLTVDEAGIKPNATLYWIPDTALVN